MELTFKKERLTILRRLKGLTIADIDSKMKELSGAKNSFNIDRWEKLDAKHPFEKVELMAKATEVPVGFYYYNNVHIKMENLLVEIHIVDTGERVNFNFL